MEGYDDVEYYSIVLSLRFVEILEVVLVCYIVVVTLSCKVARITVCVP